MSYESLSPDEKEIALAVQHIRERYKYKYSQLTQALGREPTAHEMLDVAGREVGVLSRLDDIMRGRWHRIQYPLPNSLLVQIWFCDVRHTLLAETS